VDLTVQGKHIEKAITDIVKRLDGFKYREAMAVLERVSYQLKDNATINLPGEALQKENAALKRQLEEQRYREQAHAALNGEGEKPYIFMSVNTKDFLKCMAIMHEIGKSMMQMDGEKIRASIEGDEQKTVIKVKTSDNAKAIANVLLQRERILAMRKQQSQHAGGGGAQTNKGVTS